MKPEIKTVLDQIKQLPSDWHGAGSLSGKVFEQIVKYCEPINLVNSLETGSGKTSLLFSHLSQKHYVFAMDDGNGSVVRVKESELLKPDTVTFVEGPTQKTLPSYPFDCRFQLIMLDGPHGYPFHHLEYYFLYPLLDPGGILVVDDIDIRTIYDMFKFLKADDMYELLGVTNTTSFFRRTDAPCFDPYADGWWLQNYNKRKRLMDLSPLGLANFFIPRSVRAKLRELIRSK